MIFTQALAAVRNEIAALFSQNAAMFVALGLNLFRGFATILVVWAGIKSALNSASGGPGFDFGRFAEFLMVISFGYAMIHYYSTPIPGFGVSFYHLITDQAFLLADQIGSQPATDLTTKLEGFIQSASAVKLVLLGPSYAVISILIVVLLSLVELVIFAVVAFGYIAVGILTLIGPIFIPFFIVPKLDFLFWGWLKSFFQYAFYPVIANAYLYVISKLLLQLLAPFDPSSFSDLAYLLATLPFILIVVGAAIYGILKIPVLVNHIFSGSSGEGGGGMIRTAASAAVASML